MLKTILSPLRAFRPSLIEDETRVTKLPFSFVFLESSATRPYRMTQKCCYLASVRNVFSQSNYFLKLEGMANVLWEHVSNLFSQSNCFPIDSTQNCQLCSSKLVVKVDPQLCQPVLTDKVENLRTLFCHQLYSDKGR